MKKTLTYMWRVYCTLWEDDASFDRLCRVFETAPDAVDAVALFIAEPTSTAFFPEDKFRRSLDCYVRRQTYFRQQGKQCGINIWPTFGEPAKQPNPDTPSLPEDFDTVVGWNGQKDPAVVCPTSPGFLRYITHRYREMAKVHPDFIWVDDDTRFTHIASVPYPCFCDRCVAGFQNGRWTRETLTAALNAPENQALRVAWSDYGADRLAAFCTAIRAAVDEIDPSIDLPFMSAGQTHTTYSGDYLNRCMTALRSKIGRPGHGFYYDDQPEGRFWKAMEVGRQRKQYPACTQSTIWEEESHPRMFLNKSVSSRLHETLLMCTMGGDGIAFNHLSGLAPYPNAFREYEPELFRLHIAKPVLEEYLRFAADLPEPGGIYPLDSIHMMAAMDCKNGWFNEGGFGYTTDAPYSIDKAEALAKCGLPLTPYGKQAQVTVLTGRTMDCLNDAALSALFDGNVILDGDALLRLEERGLAALAGVHPGQRIPTSYEQCTDHPMNAGFEGTARSALDSGLSLVPTADGVQSLCDLYDPYGRCYGPCMTVYANERGGRVAVFGYQPWKFLGEPFKFRQLQQLAVWFGLPGYISFAKPYAIGKLVPYIRTDGKRAAVTVINSFLDDAPPFEIRLKGSMTQATVLDLDGHRTRLTARRDGDYAVFDLPTLLPWREVIVLAD